MQLHAEAKSTGGLLPFGVTPQQASAAQARRRPVSARKPVEPEEPEGFATTSSGRKPKQLPTHALPKVRQPYPGALA